MDTSSRGLERLDPKAFDEYIDSAIDQLFVPRRSPEPLPAGVSHEKPSVGSPAAEAHADPLEALQEALLSLDWEVSTRNIAEFEQRVKNAARHGSGDRNLASVVQMVTAVCKYLVARGDAANSLGVQFPGAAVRTLEVLLARPPAAPQECRAAVARLHEKYKLLQAEVRRGEGAAPPSQPGEGAGTEGRAAGVPPSPPAPVATDRVAVTDQGPGLATPAVPAHTTVPADAGAGDATPSAGEPSGMPEAGKSAEATPAPGADEMLGDGGEGRGASVRADDWRDRARSARTACAEAAAGLAALCSREDAWPRTWTSSDAEDLGQALDRLAAAAQAVVGRLPPVAKELTGVAAVPADASMLSELAQAVARIEQRLVTAVPTPAAPLSAQEPAGKPLLVVSGAEGATALAADAVVRAVRVSPKKARAVRDRGYATLADVCGFFESVGHGVSGPLARQPSDRLKRLQFPLIRRLSGTGQVLVFLSDGENHRALLADEPPASPAEWSGGPTLNLSE